MHKHSLYIEVSAGKTGKNSSIMMPQDNGILPYRVFEQPITLVSYDRIMCCVFNLLAQSATRNTGYRPHQKRRQRALKPVAGWLWLPSQ